jgi:hypothetical protein
MEYDPDPASIMISIDDISGNLHYKPIGPLAYYPVVYNREIPIAYVPVRRKPISPHAALKAAEVLNREVEIQRKSHASKDYPIFGYCVGIDLDRLAQCSGLFDPNEPVRLWAMTEKTAEPAEVLRLTELDLSHNLEVLASLVRFF